LILQGEACTRISTSTVPFKIRYIPITENGLLIRKKFLKYYLEQHLWEYLALGELKELLDRQPLIEEGYKLPEPFYWDLW
jgi:hypothetical protein